MKVKVEIDVTPRQYFMHLCNGVISDIRKQTGKQVCLKDIMDGYYYERTVSQKKNKATVRMRVGSLIQDKYFELSYETDDTKGKYYYDFSESEDKYYVTYCEESDYKNDGIGSYFGRLRKKLREKSLQRKILNNIELTTTYIKNHENV